MESSLAIKASSGKTVTEEKDEPQPSTSYPSNENINEELFLSDTLLENEKMYKRRSGTTDSGRDYEYKMLTLLCIRCILKNPEDMWLATNAMHVGDFDDIILNMKTKGNPRKTYMMQIKHKDLPSEITDADFIRQGKFDLIKHTQSFSKLEKTLVNTIRSGDIIENLDPDKIVSVFFTNRIAANSGIPYFEKSINPDLTLLNTRAKNKHLYKFNSITGRALDLTNWDYCRNIYFLSNQVNETDADVCILEEMQKLIKQLGLIKINSRKIAKDFTEYVTKWAKCKSKDMQYLTKKQVLYKLTDLFISKYAVKLKNEPCAFYDCPTKNIWNRIVHDKIITYVAFDIMAFTFLKEYIGSEVRKYHFTLENKWINNLSDENKKLFFDKNSNLKRPMLNITGEIGTLTMLDVYKCLWLNNKIPLLLEINSKKDHQNILNILKWSKLYLKIIIVKVNKVDLMLSTSLHAKTNFFNLNDLNEENRKLILEQSVSLQGRKGHKLGDLINESMYKFIKCNDIIHILLGNYNIGNVYSLTDKYFIERSVYRPLIKFEVLVEIKDELFIIHNEAPKELLINKLRNLNLNYSESNIIVVQCVKEEDIKELKLKHDTIHRLIFYGGNSLEWMESQGQTKHIKKHLVQMNNSHRTIRFYDKICEDVLKNNVLNKTHVFSGYPGMGKSTLMDFISNKAPTNMWVLKITLYNHIEHYKTAQFKKASDHIKYFNEKIINNCNCFNILLAEAVFWKLLTENKILILMDGFDEVLVPYKDRATKIIKTIYESGYHTWISTRPHMNSHLEEEFDTIAVTITPFDLQDQRNFFIKYFTEFIRNATEYKALIDEFIENLLEAAKKNLNDWDLEFMEIPLQCKLLADYFIDDLNASLSRNIISSIEDFNLLQLYEHCINKKKEILCNKYSNYAMEMHEFFSDYQKLLALKVIFIKSDLCELDIDRQLSDYQNKNNCMEVLQREGVLVVHEKEQIFSATFVHRTFAEFIAAQWLVENYDSKDSKIKNTVEYLLNIRFGVSDLDKFLFRIFDSLFAKEFPLHSAIINKQITEITQIKEILTRSPEDINKFDKCKRSILHLIAVYFDTNTNYHHTDHKVVNNSTAVLEIIETIPIRQMIDLCGKDDFGYNPLDYAFLCGCQPIVDKLCEISNEIVITFDIGIYEHFVLTRDYKFEFELELNERFQYLGWKCIERDLKDNVSLLLGTVNCKYSLYFKNLNLIRITDLIEKFKIKSTRENYYFDLRFAAAFGTIDNVKQLLAKGVDVNQRIFGYTPLFCAVQKNRLKIVEMLLLEKVEVNATCVKSNTALHAASEAGYGNLVEILIKNGANVNKRNKHGETALYLASKKPYLNIVNLLLQHKADVSIITYSDDTCFHVAAKVGFYKLIYKFIQNGMDINTSNAYGKTPLFLALEHRQLDIANLLIKQDMKVDITDFRGDSYLHAAAAAGQIDIIRILIEKGLDINRQNKDGKTPLFCALTKGHSNVAKFLFSKKAKVDSLDIRNNQCLHFAAKLGESGIVRYMVKEGLNINFENEDGETPLSVALKNGHVSVVELLLKNNAKIDGVDRFGNTCLHAAATAHRTHIVSRLINAGLDVNKQNDLGKTPLSVALENGHVSVVELLLKNNSKIDGVDRSGNTCLHAAAHTDQSHVVRRLINAGLDVNKQNNAGQTPLLIALYYGCLDAAKTLISCGADLNLRAELNSCHLEYAVRSGCLEDWIKFLIKNNYTNTNDRKYDLTVINWYNRTLLHISVYKIYPESIAKLQHHKKTVKFLLSSGIDVNKEDYLKRTVLHYISDYNYSWVIGKSLTDDFYENVASLILNTDIDINAEDINKETALDLATRNRHHKIASLIRQKINSV